MSERVRYTREMMAMARAENRPLYTVSLWTPVEGMRPVVIEVSGLASPATEFAIDRLLRSIATPNKALCVTSLEVEDVEACAHIVSVWIRDKLASTLMVAHEDTEALLGALAGPETKIERE
jgi:hypothetical protein